MLAPPTARLVCAQSKNWFDIIDDSASWLLATHWNSIYNWYWRYAKQLLTSSFFCRQVVWHWLPLSGLFAPCLIFQTLWRQFQDLFFGGQQQELENLESWGGMATTTRRLWRVPKSRRWVGLVSCSDNIKYYFFWESRWVWLSLVILVDIVRQGKGLHWKIVWQAKLHKNQFKPSRNSMFFLQVFLLDTGFHQVQKAGHHQTFKPPCIRTSCGGLVWPRHQRRVTMYIMYHLSSHIGF